MLYMDNKKHQYIVLSIVCLYSAISRGYLKYKILLNRENFRKSIQLVLSAIIMGCCSTALQHFKPTVKAHWQLAEMLNSALILTAMILAEQAFRGGNLS